MRDADDMDLARWLADGPEHGSREHLSAILRTTRATPQHRSWIIRLRWAADPSTGPDAAAAPAALLAVVLLALLLAALGALAAVASQRPHRPAPFGPAANGRLAYVVGGTIHLADRDGGGEAAVPGGGADATPAFSPDGTRLAFWSRLPGDGGYALYVADADGNGRRRVGGDLAVHANVGYAPAWSPDSSRLLFASTDHGVGRLYVAPADGGGAALAITGLDATRWAPAWSPDGEWIAFGRQTPGPSPMDAVALIRPDGTGERTLHEQPALPDEAAFAESLSWSPDSTRVAYMRGRDAVHDPDDMTHRYAAVLAWAGLDRVEHRLYVEASGWLHLPAWSPDGSRVVFTTGEPGALTVRVVGAAGDGARPVAQCGGPLDDLLGWSPDSRWVVVACPGKPMLAPLDGSPSVPLPLPPGTTMFDWQRIAP